MSLESKLNDFVEKHNLDDSAMKELLNTFNEVLISLANEILTSRKPTVEENPCIKKTQSVKPLDVKRWATKIAGNYASENNITLDDFENKIKITKKDIDEHIKSRSVEKQTKSFVIKPNKELCKGITKTGDPCGRHGSENPSGSKNFYCTLHSKNWKNYEVSSDSSDLEEENENVCENISDNENLFENTNEIGERSE